MKILNFFKSKECKEDKELNAMGLFKISGYDLPVAIVPLPSEYFDNGVQKGYNEALTIFYKTKKIPQQIEEVTNINSWYKYHQAGYFKGYTKAIKDIQKIIGEL